MKLIVLFTFLYSLHFAASLSHCKIAEKPPIDIIRFNNQNLSTYGLHDVPKKEVTYRLWTRDQKYNFIPIFTNHLNDIPHFRLNKPFKIIVHGWSDCADAQWIKDIKDELLKQDDYNVIQVDWSKPASALYVKSSKYCKSVGNIISELIVDLHLSLSVPVENIHLIGHSLGAHISGFAGKAVQRTIGKTIGRITGLDPAGPLFVLALPKHRLSKKDALYVDVIHTDAGKLGLNKDIGHADFYPNNGNAPQPGCLLWTRDIVDFNSCSHTLAYKYYIESIHSKQFLSHACKSFKLYKKGKCHQNSLAVMGENNKLAKGVYFLKTNAKTLYARNGKI